MGSIVAMEGNDNAPFGIHGIAILGSIGNTVDCNDVNDGSVGFTMDFSN